jgi:hypothetical protein
MENSTVRENLSLVLDKSTLKQASPVVWTGEFKVIDHTLTKARTSTLLKMT